MIQLERQPIVLCHCALKEWNAELLALEAYGCPKEQIDDDTLPPIPRVVLRGDGHLFSGICHKCSRAYLAEIREVQ